MYYKLRKKNPVILLFLFTTGDWTQDFANARQELYHRTTFLGPKIVILNCSFHNTSQLVRNFYFKTTRQTKKCAKGIAHLSVD